MDKATNTENKNVKGALAYLLGPFTGAFFLLTEKSNGFVRFHAMQSLILFGALFIVHIVLTFSLIGLILIPFLTIAEFVLWILLMWKAFNGEEFMLPVVGELAKKQLMKMK
ncbi:MAG: hypothetical protein M1450_03260 [Patescibacteria group bacterium]|nr:hypothetical protein [Patescibacteria group bacterium]